MTDIRIELSRSLTSTLFQIPDITPFLDGADGQTISLEPGDYKLRLTPITITDFSFQVTTEGLVNYDSRYDTFLQGRGTTTLSIEGFRVILDARSLSNDLYVFGITGSLLSLNETHELTLIPARGYGFSVPPAGIVDLQFNVNENGEVKINQRFKDVAAASGQTLTINGHQITIDGRALSYDVVPLVTGTPLTRAITHDLHLLPLQLGPNSVYSLRPDSRVTADFQFNLDGNGQVVVGSGYACLAAASGRTLTINGFKYS